MPAVVHFEGTVLYFPTYCTIRLKLFSLHFLCFLMYHLCENYYKPVTVQCYTASYVSWGPRLTLLDLNKFALGLGLIHM